MSTKHAVHGGAFFDAIGVRLDRLEGKQEVISADVLDAWYDPSPRVIGAIQAHLPWLIKTSPPTHSEGLREVIAEVRGVSAANLLLGAGTSTLMFQVFPRLVSPGARVVVLDPTYGEYPHLVENVIGGQIVRVPLPLDGFRPDIAAVAEAAKGAALVVLVNPNSPTGIALRRAEVQSLLAQLPAEASLWIDETYIDFLGAGESAETLVALDPRLIVAKSMSKFYSLSGLRLGYLVASAARVENWEPQSPPWNVGLIAQLAGIQALQDAAYYEAQRQETVRLRDILRADIEATGQFVVTPSDANYLIARRPAGGVAALCARLAEAGVFVRNCDSLSPRFQDDHIRVAIKDEVTLARMRAAFESALT